MTTYSTSTVQRYTDALLENLRDEAKHPELEKVLLTDGLPPASYLQAGEWLMLGDVEIERKWAAIGNPKRPQEENYKIHGMISCLSASVPNDISGQAALTRRCLVIFASLETELRGDPTQGVQPLTGAETGGWVFQSLVSSMHLTKRANDTARESALEFVVSVKARL